MARGKFSSWFSNLFEAYLHEIQNISELLTVLVAEALDLDPAVFNKFFQKPLLNAVRAASYPSPYDLDPTEKEFQGVGPPKDGSFLTYLLQGTEHTSLEVQTKSGAWVQVPPIPDTFVINIGRLLEAITHGVCVATTHRVMLNREQYTGTNNRPLGKRVSAAFFQVFHARASNVGDDTSRLKPTEEYRVRPRGILPATLQNDLQ